MLLSNNLCLFTNTLFFKKKCFYCLFSLPNFFSKFTIINYFIKIIKHKSYKYIYNRSTYCQPPKIVCLL